MARYSEQALWKRILGLLDDKTLFYSCRAVSRRVRCVAEAILRRRLAARSYVHFTLAQRVVLSDAAQPLGRYTHLTTKVVGFTANGSYVYLRGVQNAFQCSGHGNRRSRSFFTALRERVAEAGATTGHDISLEAVPIHRSVYRATERSMILVDCNERCVMLDWRLFFVMFRNEMEVWDGWHAAHAEPPRQPPEQKLLPLCHIFIEPLRQYFLYSFRNARRGCMMKPCRVSRNRYGRLVPKKCDDEEQRRAEPAEEDREYALITSSWSNRSL